MEKFPHQDKTYDGDDGYWRIFKSGDDWYMLYMTEMILHGCADITVSKNLIGHIILNTSVDLHEVSEVKENPAVWMSLNLL